MNSAKMNFTQVALFASILLYAAAAIADPGATGQLDELDKQELLAHIGHANACSASHDFTCATAQLNQAKKYANTVADREMLKKAWEKLEFDRQTAVADDAKQKYGAERDAMESRAETIRREADSADRANLALANRSIRAANEKAQRAEAAASSNGLPGTQSQSTNSPFQGLDAINKVMSEGQRNIAAAQAERARQMAAQQKEDESRKASIARDRRQADSVQLTQSESNRRQAESDRAAEQAALQKEMQRHDDALKLAKKHQEQALEETHEKQRRDQEQAAKLAKQKADDEAAKRAQLEELAALRNGIRLHATTCPDGEGRYYATGILPKLKKQPDCIDVSFEASCPGSAAISKGIAKNFIGVSGCFGDTYDIDPKLACPAKLVKIIVTDVQPGCKFN